MSADSPTARRFEKLQSGWFTIDMLLYDAEPVVQTWWSNIARYGRDVQSVRKSGEPLISGSGDLADGNPSEVQMHYTSSEGVQWTSSPKKLNVLKKLHVDKSDTTQRNAMQYNAIYDNTVKKFIVCDPGNKKYGACQSD